ncbi:TRL-like family protein [Leptospira inadai serovar Lyme str. 10]|uniref:TRL-like family protein n=2 Tax=Leptospira inadai serovar Lyme TaxID=293084 RepID=V6HCF1_9LEPT|nr:TRL-like family protein [Leptospira inadai]EQA37541.1 TRL-like family protein [Leptospira inadai serovar Lyme str. 10]PNV75139.1 TRL-like family protein [Leptospira inadai serovar Lyme]
MKYRILFFSIILSVCSCTGFNAFHYAYGASPNTNPAKDYSNPNYMVVKGGFFWHKAVIPGPIGQGTNFTRVGTACSKSFLGAIAIGDSSLETAKQNAKITKVAYIDYEQFGILAGWAYHRFCTNVHGFGTGELPETKPNAQTKPNTETKPGTPAQPNTQTKPEGKKP